MMPTEAPIVNACFADVGTKLAMFGLEADARFLQ